MSKTEIHRAEVPQRVKDSSKPLKVLGRVPLRRKTWTVLRMNALSHFVCGLCGKFYGFHEEAFRCLQSCARRALLDLREKPLLTRSAAHFACPLCGRQLLSQIEAQACLASCVQKIAIQLKISVPQRPPEIVEHLHSHSLSYMKRMALEALPRRQGRLCDKSVFKNETGRNPYFARHFESQNDKQVGGLSDPFQDSTPTLDDHLDESLDSNQTAEGHFENEDSEGDGLAQNPKALTPTDTQGASNNSKTSDVDIKLTRRRGQKPFTRMDARYGCTVCKLKYFTKEEVAECFNSHPLRD